MQSDIVQRLDYWRDEMQRTIKALESNPEFADVVDGNRSIYTTLGMAKSEITFSRTTIANLTEALRAAEERADEGYQAAIADVVEWLGVQQHGRTSDNYPGYYARQIEQRFGKDA